MPIARSWSLIGGYTCASQPVTVWPSSAAILARPPMKVPQMPRMWRCMPCASPRGRLALEDEIDGAHHAHRRPQVVPLEALAHVEHREGHEHGEGDDLLHDLQLRKRDAALEADAVCRDLQQVLEKGDAPARRRGHVPSGRLQVLQMPVPGERHEHVGCDEERDGRRDRLPWGHRNGRPCPGMTGCERWNSSIAKRVN